MSIDPVAESRCAIDTPLPKETLGRVFRVSGWYCSPDGQPADGIQIIVDGKPVATASRVNRLDVAQALLHLPKAASFGFYGDVFLDSDKSKGQIRIDLDFLTNSTHEKVHVGSFSWAGKLEATPERSRSYKFEDILSDECRKALAGRNKAIYSPQIAGVQHFHESDDRPLIRLLEPGQTAGYPPKSFDLIDAMPKNGLFLDLGCGIRTDDSIRENGVYLDAVHFPTVDLVSSRATLPFADETFDLVISHAVFEHLPDPHNMARQIERVLKPGGVVYVETAFMQPVHGAPDHYFNMTSSGLAKVFQGFEIESIFVAPHQRMSNGLLMQFEMVLPFLPTGRWRSKLEEWLNELRVNGVQLDSQLGAIGGEVAAAGFAILARKAH